MTRPHGHSEADTVRLADAPSRRWSAERFRAAVRELAERPLIDDGSLAVRLAGQPSLIDSMLGRDLLDPLELYPPATGWPGAPRPRISEPVTRRSELDHPSADSPDARLPSTDRPDLSQPSGDRPAADEPSLRALEELAALAWVSGTVGGFPGDAGFPGMAGRPREAGLAPDATVDRCAGAGLPAAVASLLDVVGPGSIADLDATIDAIVTVRSRVNALEALEGVLLERARRQALRAQVLDEEHLLVRNSVGDQRRDLARRAVVSDIALATRSGEQAVNMRLTRAQALCVRAPRTLTAALEGKVGWAHAAHLADAVAELQPATATALDAAVVTAAGCQNPRVFARTVRRHRDRLHPTPLAVRHEEAATRRGIDIIPAADGMAYLNLYATAPIIHAVFARVTDTAKHARTTGDPRTLNQLRADVTAALLLDDGTLDLTATWQQPTLAAERRPVPAAARPDERSANPQQERPPRAADPDNPLGGAPPVPERHQRTLPGLATLARSVRPRVFVTVPVLTLLGRSDEPAMLDGTVPIDAETAEALTALAPSLTRLLTHPVSGNVLAVDSRTYVPPAGLRHHLTARDTTCRFPGCTRPAIATDADHTRDFAHGGTTTATNLALLCRGHHVLKHQARFTLTQKQDGSGTLIWATPTGRIYTTTPEPVPATVHTRLPAPIDIPDPGDEPPWTAPTDPHPDLVDPHPELLDHHIAATGSRPVTPVPALPALRPAWEAPWGDEAGISDAAPGELASVDAGATPASTSTRAREHDWGDPPF